MLPDNDTPWPPPLPGLAVFYGQVSRWSDWYGDRTGALYATTETAGGTNRWSLADLKDMALNRGQRPVITMSPTALGSTHVPVAADVARTSADLLFSELPEFQIEKDPGAAKRLAELQSEIGLEALLPEAAELCAALSAIYWRVGYDTATLPDRPWLDFPQPDQAVPEFSRGRLVAVTFWDVLPKPPRGQEGTWRHLERHTVTRTLGGVALPAPVAVVEHGLYVGEGDSIGRRMPLDEHPMTRGMTMTTEDFIVMPAGVPMTAGMVKNMGPNRVLRQLPYGRADIAGMEGSDGPLVGIDKAWTSWMRDLDLGKGRAVVPEDFLRTDGAGRGAAFDIDRAIYSPLRKPPNSTGTSIEVIQFAIRVAEHRDTFVELFKQVARSAGYSLGSFGMADDAGAMTATEVKAKLALSMTTREKKTRYWTPELRKISQCLLAVDALVLGNRGAVADADVNVIFGESVAEDPKTTAETVALLAQAEAASTRRKVELVNPDWDEGQVTEEVGLIEASRQIPVPAPLNDDESDDEQPAGGEPFGADLP